MSAPNKMAVRAARAAQNPTITGKFGTVLPVAPMPPRLGRIRRPRAKMTLAQRDSAGHTSDWSRSATYFCPVEIDRRWDK